MLSDAPSWMRLLSGYTGMSDLTRSVVPMSIPVVRKHAPGWLLIGCLLSSAALPTQAGSTDCRWQNPHLICQVYPSQPLVIQSAELRVEHQNRVIPAQWQPRGITPHQSAILWLLDVSDPQRANALASLRKMLSTWLPRIENHAVGLAQFTASAQLLAPVGTPPAQLAAILNDLKIQGQTTGLYRSLLDGIAWLALYPAQDKSLWIFSNGNAQDTAYFHDDVVKAAHQARIRLIGIGLPERAQQVPALQRLQRLAEETGGYFLRAPVRGTVTPAAFNDLLTVIRGVEVTATWTEPPNWDDPHPWTLRLMTVQQGSVDLPVIPAHIQRPEVQRPETSMTPAMTDASPAPDTPASPTKGGITAGTLLTVLLLAALGMVIVFILLIRRLMTIPAAEPLPLARLEILDAGGQVAIPTPIFRIGRAADNDLVLHNDSVSAHHAELQQRRDGSFMIVDLGATNGVWMGEHAVHHERLHDGDVFELGEVRLRFHQIAPITSTTASSFGAVTGSS